MIVFKIMDQMFKRIRINARAPGKIKMGFVQLAFFTFGPFKMIFDVARTCGTKRRDIKGD